MLLTGGPDAANEELRVQINKLKYELENQQQERELLTLQHNKELRDLQARAEADYKKAQVSEKVCSCSC